MRSHGCAHGAVSVSTVSSHMRRRARTLAAQAVHMMLATPNSDIQASMATLRNINAHDENDENQDVSASYDEEFFNSIIDGVDSKEDEIGDLLRQCLDRPLNQVSYMEASVIIVAVSEFLCCPETPKNVIINEAIEIAKEFGSTGGHKYVNGVLDCLSKLDAFADRNV